MEKWRRIELVGILLGNGALLIDYVKSAIEYTRVLWIFYNYLLFLLWKRMYSHF